LATQRPQRPEGTAGQAAAAATKARRHAPLTPERSISQLQLRPPQQAVQPAPNGPRCSRPCAAERPPCSESLAGYANRRRRRQRGVSRRIARRFVHLPPAGHLCTTHVMFQLFAAVD